MNRNLPDDIDNFFLNNLENYSDDPDDDVWLKIDQRLSIGNKKQRNWWLTSLSAAAILILWFLPGVLKDAYSYKSFGYKKISGNSFNDNTKSHLNSEPIFRNEFSKADRHLSFKQFQDKSNSKNKATIVSLNNYLISNNDSESARNSVVFYNDPPQKKVEAYNNSEPYLSENKIELSNQNTVDKSSATISLSGSKNKIEVIPFFSVDHISGRFIEQYEFDNDHKTDYTKREKPDVSFTGGLLASYQFNKKFSFLSGLSFSKSSVAISSTAVKALQDANGIYKFKLATSYGFAEISKSGVTPNAGDSLFVSNGMMELDYISFPVLIKYNFGNKKIKWGVYTGIGLNKVLSDKVQIEYTINNNDDNETVNKIEGVRRTFFTLNTGIEARYTINHSIDVSLSPELRYGINSINKGTPVKTYPINIGLGLNFHIKL